MGKEKTPIEQVKREFIDAKLKPLFKTYKNQTEKLLAETLEGYKVVITLKNLRKGQTPNAFDSHNPYTIDNIKLFINKNNIELILISDVYTNDREKLIFYCVKHGNIELSWSYLRSKKCCNCCKSENNKMNNESRRKQIELKKSLIIPRNTISFHQWCITYNRQDLLDRWDYELNENNPSYYPSGSNTKVWFKCPRGLHNSELKKICDIPTGKSKVVCNVCKSFGQWCLDNGKQDLLNRWDYELNKCSPYDINHGTIIRYYFKCPRGLHDSESKNLHSFAQGNTSLICLKCNSFAQWGIDKFGEDFLDKYWDYEKNDELGIDPWELTWGSRCKVWLICQEKDYHGSYPTPCGQFSSKEYGRGSGCQYCGTNKDFVHILDSLGTIHPIVFDVWSDENKTSPYDFSPNTHRKVLWKCENNIHKDFPRGIQRSSVARFKCPDCVRERDESFLQEKVRLHIESFGYTILHEHKCTIVPKNPKRKTNGTMPFDNEIVELKFIIEVMGKQHYKISNFTIMTARNNNTTPEYELHMQQVRDRYKRIFAKSRGYFYVEIPYWTDNKDEDWKKLIDNKVNDIIENCK